MFSNTKNIYDIEKTIQNPPRTPFLDWIKAGKKTFEGRLKTKIDEWNLYIGKKIKFFEESNPKSWVIVEIICLEIFKNFDEAYDKLGYALIPEHSKVQVVDLYNKLFHYSDEKLENGKTSRMIDEIGVVAIGIKVISMNE